MATVIENGTIVTSASMFVGDILIRRGKIAVIGRGLRHEHPESTCIDATGKLVIPGAIDGHTHLNMPVGDIRSTDDFLTGTRAALFGGTTTIVDYANQTPGQSLTKALEKWKKWADGQAVCDYGFHVTVCDPRPDRLREIPKLASEGISSFKCFFAYPDRLMIDDAAFLKLMSLSARHNLLINLHAENGHMVSHATKQLLDAGRTGPDVHHLAHPREAEVEAVQRALNLMTITGGMLNIVHVSCAESMDRIAIAKRNGIRVFAETCPQYLVLTDRLYSRTGMEATKWIMSPPLRKIRDSRALWAAMAGGTIDTVGTDHCPFNYNKEKRNARRFDRVPNGIPGIEDRVELLYSQGVRNNRISPTQWVQLVATNPARMYGLYPKKGDIIPGADADLVIFNPGHRHVISEKSRHMRVDYNPYAGLEITGKVEQVFLRGHAVVDQDQLLVEPGFGRFLKRGRPRP